MQPSDAEDRPPNVVLILADDLGWADLGCFGSEYYLTPNIDRLSTEGMRFTNAYSSGPNCAPTRASLMTGRYPPRHGIYTVATGARGLADNRQLEPAPTKTELSPGALTIAEVLQRAGYATGHFGKWHLGGPPNTDPQHQGFDVNVGGNRRGAPRSYFSPYQNRAITNGPDGENLTDRLATEAITFMETHREQPFFVYLATYAVHTPLQAKPELIEKYKKRKAVDGQSNPTYAAMIEALDTNVGRVLEAIDELGLRERTIVIFVSDNGGVGGYEGLQTRDITSNKPLRGGKGMLYEGGIRVPMIVRIPGVTVPGAKSAVPVNTVDLLATITACVSRATLPEHYHTDGIDLSPLFSGDESTFPADRAIFWHFPGYLQANARAGTWRTTPASAIRKGRYKLIEFFEDGGRVELYDLVDDIGETHDLADDLPDVARDLHERLRAWREDVHALMPTAKSAEEPYPEKQPDLNESSQNDPGK